MYNKSMNIIHTTMDEAKENKALFFILLLSSIFVLAQFVVGFQLGLFAVAMGVAIFFTFWRPMLGLYATLLLTLFFERFYTLQSVVIGRTALKLYPVDVVMIAVFIALVIGMISRVRSGKIRLSWRKTDALFTAFLVYITILFVRDLAIGESVIASTAFSTWKNYLFYGLLYFAVPLLLQNEEKLKRFVSVYLAGSIGILVYVLIGIVRQEGLWTEFTPLSTNGVRILALPHAYYYSIALLGSLLSLPYIKSLKHHGSRYASIVLASIPLWIIGVIGSLMRHLWIGLFFALGVMWFMVTKKYRQELFRFATGSVVSIIMFTIILLYGISLFPHSHVSSQVISIGDAVSNRFVSLGDSGDTSISWRNSVWREAWTLFSQHAVFGAGFGATVPVEIDAYKEYVEIRNIHNSWLAMLVQVGVVGFGLMLGFLWSLVFSLKRLVLQSEFLQSMQYATLGVFLFQCMIFLYQPYLETNLLNIFFWVNLGVMRTLIEVQKPH